MGRNTSRLSKTENVVSRSPENIFESVEDL